MSDLSKRLQALEAVAAVADEPPVLLFIMYAGDETEPAAELCEEGRRWAKATGEHIVTFEREHWSEEGGAAGPWRITNRGYDGNTQQG